MSLERDLKSLYPFLHGKSQDAAKLGEALLRSVDEKARELRETNARFFEEQIRTRTSVWPPERDVLPHDRRVVRHGRVRGDLRHRPEPHHRSNAGQGPRVHSEVVQPADDQSRRAGQAEVDRGRAVLLHEVHRCGHALHQRGLRGGSADLLRRLPLEFPAPRGRVAQDRPDGRRRGGERLTRPQVVTAGDGAGAHASVGPGEPGRALSDLGGTGRNRSSAACGLVALPPGR